MNQNSMDEQMQDLEVDPVSGNEVPPGSLPEEVRDDVDAKLSEGEYVIPADVVRFFGVDYFEKLRKKAKEGLAQMDADGRIGGEPVPAEDTEEDLPFSDEELMAMEEGGEEAPVGMAEGGSVKGTFNPADYAAGFSANAAGSSSSVTGVQNKTYMNKDGEQRVIMFVNGQPIQQIPAGFVEATPENKAELTKQQVSGNVPAGEVETEFSGGQGTSDSDQGFAPDAPDIGNMDADALADFAQNEFGAMQGIANAAGMFGLGAVAKAGVNMTGKAVAARAQELGVPNPLGKDGKKGLIGRAMQAMKGGDSNTASMGQGFDGNFGAEYGAAQAHAAANPTGMTTGTGLSVSQARGPVGLGAPAPSVSTSGSTGGRGGGGGSSSGGSGPSGDSGEAGYGGGYGGYAARGMLVDKKVRQKQKPKPEGKGLVKRKPKDK